MSAVENQPGYFDDVKKMFEETDRRMQETDRKLKEVGRQLGRFGNEIGFFVQELVKPGLIRLLGSRGIMEKFIKLFPEYRQHRIMGAVAGMSVPANSAAYAESKGFFVIAPRGEDVVLMNSEGFEPKMW